MTQATVPLRQFLGLLVVVVLTLSGILMGIREYANPRRVPPFPLGDTLANVNMISMATGAAVGLQQRIGAAPAVIYIYGPTQLAGCADLALEFRIIRSLAPEVTTLLVASGAPRETFAAAIDAARLGAVTLIDENRALVRLLRLSGEPAVLLVTSKGRIVFVDTRSAGKALNYPMGRVLLDLRSLLAASHDSANSKPPSLSISNAALPGALSFGH